MHLLDEGWVLTTVHPCFDATIYCVSAGEDVTRIIPATREQGCTIEHGDRIGTRH